ncbi:hypothetical protein GCM10023258_06040 [Terrabacter aeriphilus]|uniref:DUF222 domain-containing protein n=1 Tax=Terrabacter aeriphilus TaxID=515662 RepID=A0ABP9J2Y5_9MICO
MPHTPAPPAAPTEPPDGGRRFPAGCFEPIRLSRGTDPEAFERAVVATLDLVRQQLDAVSAALAAARAKAEDADDAGAEGVERAERDERAGVLEGLARAGEVALARIEALEAAQARVEADLLEAYGALHAIESRQLDALPAAPGRAGLGRVGLDRVVGEEIALATGIGTGEVARRLSVATAPRRHAAALAALRSGRCALARVLQFAAETAALSDADVARVAENVLAPARGGGPLPQRTFVTRLRRAVASLDGHCRGPGCETPAARCDLDHEAPYPAGPTGADNLYAKHRFHRNTKTTGAWTSRPVTEGTPTGLPGRALEWTTLTGRTCTTHPKNWREGLELPTPAPTDRTRGRSGGTAPPQASSPDGSNVPPS